MGDGNWGEGMGSELVCRKAVVGVEYDPAGLLCPSRRSGVDRGGEGSLSEREGFQGYP